MKKLNIIKFIIVSVVLFSATSVFASELYFETLDKEVSINQQFKIDLNIDTEKENINAIEGKIIFSTDILELLEIRSSNSIVNFWVDKPVYKDGGVYFSGITPGGYVLDKGLVLSLVFKAKKDGYASIQILNASTLKNDGLGTKSVLKTSDLKLSIIDSMSDSVLEDVIDTEAPDTFKPEIAQDTNILDNKWFVVFVAQDKTSGIERYEIRESKYRIFNFAKWKNADSPYVLDDQNLNSNVYIKAIDKKGNIRVVRLSPQNPISWYANLDYWFIIILVITVALTVFYFSKNRK